jgi:hypothetical protein
MDAAFGRGLKNAIETAVAPRPRTSNTTPVS